MRKQWIVVVGGILVLVVVVLLGTLSKTWMLAPARPVGPGFDSTVTDRERLELETDSEEFQRQAWSAEVAGNQHASSSFEDGESTHGAEVVEVSEPMDPSQPDGPILRGLRIGGKKEGVWRVLDEEGRVSQTRTYRGGALDGKAEHFWQTGLLQQSLQYVNNKVDGLARTFHPDGTLAGQAEYSLGVKQGPWVEYFSSGAVSGEGQAEAGRWSGNCTWYLQNGSQDDSRTGFYVNGVRVGPVR